VDASVWVPSVALVLGALITAWGQRGTRRAVREVHDEVRTGNTKTSGNLLALSEGRRIRADVPESLRTQDERHYVEQVTEDESPQH
jgi:hypothetical protein